MSKRDICATEILARSVKRKIQNKVKEMGEPLRKQNYTIEEVLDSYQRLGSIPAVTQQTGCPPYIVFKWLKFRKMLKPTDGMKYGSASSKKGFEAETEFKKLVPFAMNANENLQNNCPSYDFDINGTTVDVKLSGIRKGGKYEFKTSGRKHFSCDFYVVFCLTGESITEGYRLLVIPAEIADTVGAISIAEKSKYWDFEIAPAELAEFFSDYLA